MAESNSLEKQGRFELPDIYVILFSFIVLVSILTWIIPAGAYERTVLPNGRETVVAGSYHVIEQTPVGIMDIVTSIPDPLHPGPLRRVDFREPKFCGEASCDPGHVRWFCVCSAPLWPR